MIKSIIAGAVLGLAVFAASADPVVGSITETNPILITDGFPPILLTEPARDQ